MTEPTWVSFLSDDSRVNARELAEWLGYSMNSMGPLLAHGTIPKPDGKMEKHYRAGVRKMVNMWRVKTIRDWIKAGKPCSQPTRAV